MPNVSTIASDKVFGACRGLEHARAIPPDVVRVASSSLGSGPTHWALAAGWGLQTGMQPRRQPGGVVVMRAVRRH
jgi:hypothetical protein